MQHLIVMLLAITIVSLTAVVIVRVNQITSQNQTIMESRLRNNVLNSVEVLYNVIDQSHGALETIVNLESVRQGVIQDSYIDETLSTIFGIMNRHDDFFANIVIYDANLNVVAAADWVGDIPNTNLFAQNVYSARLGFSYNSIATINPVTGDMQSLLSMPIFYENEFYGMAAVLINLELMGVFLREPEGAYDGFISIADRSGTIFFSQHEIYLGHHIDDLEIVAPSEAFPTNQLLSHVSPFTEMDVIVYVYIDDRLNWIVVNFFDASELGSVFMLVFVSLLPTVSGIIVASALMLIFIKRTLKPLEILAQKAQEVANGNRNVTFEKHKNDEIGLVFDSFNKVISSLKSLINEAELALQAKSDFLSKMSHEIRTPLNVIIGKAEMVLREDLPENIREQIEASQNAGLHLLTVINSILDFTKVESGKLEIVPSEYLLHSTISDVVSIMNARIVNPNVEFIALMKKNVPNRLVGDEVRIRQILLNILTNSVKYTERGQISLDVDWKKTGDDSLNLVIKISDTGTGIKQEEIGNIFEEFRQSEMSKHNINDGTGLGLSLTNSFVRLMGGEIKVESIYGLGSAFTVILPQKYGEESKSKVWDGKKFVESKDDVFSAERIRIKRETATQIPVTFSVPDARLLVVDDASTNLLVAKELLSLYTNNIDTCFSGQESIKMVQETNYDIVFMDHMMPEMDGVEAVKIMRELEDGRFKSLPIVALTANAILGAREMFLENGFSDFLPKPIEMKKLGAILEKWIPTEKQIPIETKKTAQEKTPKDKENNELEIDGVDIAKGMKIATNNKEMYKLILGTFLDDGTKKLNQIKQALKENDISLYTTYIHAIKSTAANVGADQIASQAELLEEAGLKHDMYYITKNTDNFVHSMEKLMVNIKKALSNPVLS